MSKKRNITKTKQNKTKNPLMSGENCIYTNTIFCIMFLESTFLKVHPLKYLSIKNCLILGRTAFIRFNSSCGFCLFHILFFFFLFSFQIIFLLFSNMSVSLGSNLDSSVYYQLCKKSLNLIVSPFYILNIVMLKLVFFIYF